MVLQVSNSRTQRVRRPECRPLFCVNYIFCLARIFYLNVSLLNLNKYDWAKNHASNGHRNEEVLEDQRDIRERVIVVLVQKKNNAGMKIPKANFYQVFTQVISILLIILFKSFH